jgi:hypothetical protein
MKPVHLAPLILTLIPLALSMWSFVSYPKVERIRRFGSFLAIRSDSGNITCLVFRLPTDGNITQKVTTVLNPPVSPSCGDFEFVWSAELNTTLLYTVEQNFFRIRQYDPSSDRFNEVTHDLINNQLHSNLTNVEILPDLDHLLIYIVTSSMVYRIDLVNGLTRPVILHQTNFLRSFFLAVPASVVIASGKMFFVGGSAYRPAMLDIGSASMRPTFIPAFPTGAARTRSVVSSDKFVFFFLCPLWGLALFL